MPFGTLSARDHPRRQYLVCWSNHSTLPDTWLDETSVTPHSLLYDYLSSITPQGNLTLAGGRCRA